MTGSIRRLLLNQVALQPHESQKWAHSPEEKHLFISLGVLKRGDM